MKLNALAAHRRGMTDTLITAETPETPATMSVPAVPPVDASLIAAPEGDGGTRIAARPEGLPEAYWDEATGAVKPEAYSRLAALEAAAAERAVPESADKYELALPEPVVGLDGEPIAFDIEDPLVKALLPAFHEAGVPQAGLSKILQAYAATEVAALKAEQEAGAAYIAGEHAKLGAGHKERTAALHGQVVAAVGAEQAEAIRSQMRSADAVIALEQLVAKIQGPALSAAPAQTPAMPDIATRLYG